MHPPACDTGSVEVVRFDPEVAIPFSRTDRGARRAPLARTGRASVELLVLDAGGRIVLDPGPNERLVALVAGTGWATGSRGERVGLCAGVGGHFERGERVELGTEEGLTALHVDGDIDLEAYRVTRDIVVVDYDPCWAGGFQTLCAFLAPAADPPVLRIDHVGSTAVPGLAAKPIIDLDLVVPTPGDVALVVERLEALGYRWRGDLGVVGREAFTPPAADLPAHHLYLVVEDSRPHQDHLLLRDLLRSDPASRVRYAELKRANAAAGRNIDTYVAAKAELVGELLGRARTERGLPPVEYWRPEVVPSLDEGPA